MEKNLLELYALYDKNETCVFIGNVNECINFSQSTRSKFYNALQSGYKISRKYYVSKLNEKERFNDKKICNKCGEEKSIDNFQKKGKYYSYICKYCYNEYMRNRYKNNTSKK